MAYLEAKKNSDGPEKNTRGTQASYQEARQTEWKQAKGGASRIKDIT